MYKRQEGALALWKGAGPTIIRAMALNMGMLASYDQSVEFFRDSLDFGETATLLGQLCRILSRTLCSLMHVIGQSCFASECMDIV